MAESLKPLRGALALTIAMLLAALFAVQTAVGRYERHIKIRKDEAHRARDMQRQVFNLRNQQEQALKYSLEFRALIQMRTVGPFDKPVQLDAFEGRLAQYADQIERYELAAQVNADVPGAQALEQHTVYAHRLELQARPRHEGALLAMLDAISDSADALHTVERCHLSRGGDGREDALGARCTVYWYSFAPKAAPAPEPRR